jgi:hypothetical protein
MPEDQLLSRAELPARLAVARLSKPPSSSSNALKLSYLKTAWWATREVGQGWWVPAHGAGSVGRAAQVVVHSEAAGNDVCSLQALVRKVPTAVPSLSYLGGEQSLKDKKSRIYHRAQNF